MRKTLLATGAAAALTLSLAAPASAERFGIDDPEGGGGTGVNLLAAAVINSNTSLRINLVHQDLRRRPIGNDAGGVVYIDTDPADKGPELVFTAGLFAGTDYALLDTEGFGVNNWGDPVNGSYSMSLDYAREKTHIEIGRNALQGADEVRVSIRVSGQRQDGSVAVDWLGKPRSFTMWLDRG